MNNETIIKEDSFNAAHNAATLATLMADILTKLKDDNQGKDISFDDIKKAVADSNKTKLFVYNGGLCSCEASETKNAFHISERLYEFQFRKVILKRTMKQHRISTDPKEAFELKLYEVEENLKKAEQAVVSCKALIKKIEAEMKNYEDVR